MVLKRIVLGVWLALAASLLWMAGGAVAQRQGQGPGQRPGQVSGGAGAQAGRQYSPPYYVFSPDIPADIVTHDTGAIGFQPFVDILAWDTFIALNWPVPNPLVQRGVPDRQNVVGGFVTSGGEGGHRTTMPTGPTVWETFKDTADIFLNPPVQPPPFDAPERIPPQCQTLAAANPAAARRTLVMEAKTSEVLQDFKQAFTHFPLIDQNGEKVWYEVKVNRAYYDYVVRNGFYNSNNQKGKTISFPSSSNVTRDAAAVKVKAAWKVMGGAGSRQPDDPKKFYTTQALILDPDTKRCTQKTVGLVGLHVVMKTEQLPQWSWATFEHVDNAPDQQAGPTPGKQYNFFSAKCAGCPLNTPPPDGRPNTPTQVVRLVPVSGTASQPNAAYQAALASLRADNVWRNYMLVDAQWALTRDQIGTPLQPKYLANTTMETYLQEPVEDEKKPHGCINCHGQFAGTQDLDFQLSKAYPHTNPARAILRSRGGQPPPARGRR
ncbi:MAG TPA: hypothetical protein VEY09_17845 [Pyrinomonadaceae bacterium]|nr:hypothetical protein [Pyrinomonadaceae bacterium]